MYTVYETRMFFWESIRCVLFHRHVLKTTLSMIFRIPNPGPSCWKTTVTFLSSSRVLLGVFADTGIDSPQCSATLDFHASDPWSLGGDRFL